MSIIYIMCGIPGSGKSTIAMEIENKWGEVNSKRPTRICPDNIREELYGDASIQGNWDDIQTVLDKEIGSLLDHDMDVIYDATNLTFARRRDFMDRYRRNDTEFVCIFVNTPFCECVSRNSLRFRKVPTNVLFRMRGELNPPLISEGFKNIIEIR